MKLRVVWVLTCWLQPMFDEIPSDRIVLVPANVIVEVPAEFMLMVASRSNAAEKPHLPLGVGIIDHDLLWPGR